MYTCKAKKQNPIGIFISAVLLTATIFFIAKSISQQSSVSSPYATIALFTLILTILTSSRFVFTSFEYSYDSAEDMLTVYEIRYRVSSVKARLRTCEISAILRIEKHRDKRSLEKNIRFRSFDYRPDILPKKYQILVSSSPSICGDLEEIRLLVSLDERMLSILTDNKSNSIL